MKRTSTLACLSLLTLAGCAVDSAPSVPDELERVPDGKADNYYSNVAAEFDVTGTLEVPMTDAQYQDEAVRADLVQRRLSALGLYLTAYVTDKFRGIDENGDGTISDDEVFFHNEGYGGFSAMVRSETARSTSVRREGDTVLADFRVNVAGPPNLLTRIPAVRESEDPSTRLFSLQMPKGASFDPQNIPRSMFRAFDPRSYTGDLETLELSLRARATIGNAFPQYTAFMEDGVFDITLFYGHDYNTSRSDISEAREAYSTLTSLGFTAPEGVTKFEDLAPDSGAFTREVKANGQDVVFEVRIFHSNMFEETRQEQHDLALSELVARDVFFYNGHAGPYYGFYLDEHDAAKVNYTEFASQPFERDRQQLAIAQGCQTYSIYADSLYANESKDESNLDVITTVNYSYGSGTMGILRSLVKTDERGNHQPVDFYTLVGDLNSDWTNRFRDVFYGVTGLDGNPQLHPYANVAKLGEACRTYADCGDGAGNVCASRTCGVVSLAPEACPEGTRFERVATGRTIVGGACFR